jgi:hypothetical protein
VFHYNLIFNLLFAEQAVANSNISDFYTAFSQGKNGIFMVLRVARFFATTVPFPASDSVVVW